MGLACLPIQLRSAPRELRILTGPDPDAQRAMLQALKVRYASLVADANPSALEARHVNGPIVCLGPGALRKGLEAEIKTTLLSIFTSSQGYRRLTSAPAHERPTVTAIFSDPAPQTQLQLIATLFERKATVGVLLSEASAYLERPLRQAASGLGIELVIERSDPAADVVRSLNRLAGAQVLLAVPDSTLYTPDTLRSVLESTYRRGLPVIGFSPATVNAGTLATTHSSIEDIVADLTELVDAWSGQGASPLPEPRFPRYWRVSVNENVARSLGITITDKVINLGNFPTGRQG